MLAVTPFGYTDSDYETLSRIWNAIHPDMLIDPEEFKFDDEKREKKYIFERYIASIDGETIGILTVFEPFWSYRPGKFFLSYHLEPKHHGKSFEDEVYRHLIEIVSRHTPSILVCNARENEPDKIKLWKSKGFEQVMRYPVSHLDLTKFEPTRFKSHVEKAMSTGIEILTLTELQERDPAWLRKWSDLDWEIVQDIPSPDELTRKPLDQYRKILNSPNYLPDGIFFALDGEQLVGTSGLWRSPSDEELLFTGLTGVVRSHRRKGIATTLKLRSFQFAKAYGAKRIETDNEEHNPMFQINLRLGFEPSPAWMDFEKKLEDA